MSDASLVHVASLLGHSRKNAEYDVALADTNNNSSSSSSSRSSSIDDRSFIHCESLSYPSFSLSQPPIKDEKGSTSCASREDIQIKASSCMSRPILKENMSNCSEGETRDVAVHMLESILDSFDQLVDARIRQYSNVLRNYSSSLSTPGAQIVEYKLRTLLEIGTNISFGSLSTSFTPSNQVFPVPTGTKMGCLSIPIELSVEVNSLRFHHPTRSTDGQVQEESSNSIVDGSKKTLTFRAPGTIRGILADDDVANDDDAPSTTAASSKRTPLASNDHATITRFKQISVQVDCDTLLKEMMEEAGKVVGTVVELTNEAWAQKQQALGTGSVQETLVEAESTEIEVDEKPVTKTTSPTLGPKVVSEVSFHPSKTGSGTSDETLQDQEECWPEQFGNSGVTGTVHARDSDEENTNPHISAENARHIIDFVFSDEIIGPSTAKKARIES